MSFALPESMREYIHNRVAAGNYGNTSEYIRDLIRRDQEEQARKRLRDLIEEGGQFGRFGQIHVLLDEAEGDPGAARQLPGKIDRRFPKHVVRMDAVDHSQRQGFIGMHRLRREVELAGLRRADEPGEEIAPPEVAGKTDLREGRHEPGSAPGEAPNFMDGLGAAAHSALAQACAEGYTLLAALGAGLMVLVLIQRPLR